MLQDVLLQLGDLWANGPQLIECPGSNTHVWNRDQCDSFDFGSEGYARGGGARRGLLGTILGSLSGGLL